MSVISGELGESVGTTYPIQTAIIFHLGIHGHGLKPRTWS